MHSRESYGVVDVVVERAAVAKHASLKCAVTRSCGAHCVPGKLTL